MFKFSSIVNINHRKQGWCVCEDQDPYQLHELLCSVLVVHVCSDSVSVTAVVTALESVTETNCTMTFQCETYWLQDLHWFTVVLKMLLSWKGQSGLSLFFLQNILYELLPGILLFPPLRWEVPAPLEPARSSYEIQPSSSFPTRMCLLHFPSSSSFSHSSFLIDSLVLSTAYKWISWMLL